ncbi:Short-chain dehydrogenase/reductase OXR1 [Psilocybe cubensis]|nr:Short-chain dehydrogenase/reductase OXR1 [Psilocybe cubensis]KAH9479742.1 Short-chain dehydrogenase/reductase OXR1 [Psilocybe cubensis]
MKLKLTDFIRDQYTSLSLPSPSQSQLTNKTILITGGNTGLGFETAVHFASMAQPLAPARVVITCRTAEKGAEAVARIVGRAGGRAVAVAVAGGVDVGGGQGKGKGEVEGEGEGEGEGQGQTAEEDGKVRVEARVLELTDFASVRAFVDAFERAHERLDILLASAAVSPTKLGFTADGWETTTQVNILSPALLTLLLIPCMMRTAHRYKTTPRILLATSELHHMATLDAAMLDSGRFFRMYGYKDDMDIKT